MPLNRLTQCIRYWLTPLPFGALLPKGATSYMPQPMAAGARCEIVITGMGHVWNAGSFDSSTFGREYYFAYFYAYAKASGRLLHARKVSQEGVNDFY